MSRGCSRRSVPLGAAEKEVVGLVGETVEDVEAQAGMEAEAGSVEAEVEVRGAAIMAKAEGTAKAATRGAVAEGWVRPRVRAAGSMAAGGMGLMAVSCWSRPGGCTRRAGRARARVLPCAPLGPRSAP